MAECGLCGIEWALRKGLGYVEQSVLYGLVWAVWYRMGCVDKGGLCGIE